MAMGAAHDHQIVGDDDESALGGYSLLGVPITTEAPLRRLVHTTVTFERGMLDESHHTSRHEAATAHGPPRPRHLGDLDDTPPGRDLDAPAGFRGTDLEALHGAGAGIH
jgi:hypothetical protein